MKYSKILLAALSISLLTACANTEKVNEKTENIEEVASISEEETKENKDIEDTKEAREKTDQEDDNSVEEKNEDKKEETGDKDDKEDKEESDLITASDFDVLKGDLMDISDEEPSSLGLEKSDKNPKELVDGFFDEKLENLLFTNYLVVGNDSEQSAQKFYGGVEYEDEKLFSGHFASLEYDNNGLKSIDELLITNNPDSEYQFYNFDQDGSPKGTDTDQDYAEISLNPEIYSLMTHVNAIADKLEAYEDSNGHTHLYYKTDELGELLELFRDDYNIKADGSGQGDFEEKIVISYLDEDNLPDRVVMTIGNGQLKMIVNTLFTDYNEVDDSMFEPVSIIDDSERTQISEAASDGPMDKDAVKSIASKISSKNENKKTPENFLNLIEKAKFQNIFLTDSEGDSLEDVDKYLKGYYEKEIINIKEDDVIAVHRYDKFEDADVGQTYDLDITLNFFEEKLSLASLTPAFYNVMPNEVINDEDVETLKTITDVDRSPAKPLSLAYMPIDDKAGIEIMIPSQDKDGNAKANYLFYIENDLVYHTDIPFDQASQDFATAAHSMFRSFVEMKMGEKTN